MPQITSWKSSFTYLSLTNVTPKEVSFLTENISNNISVTIKNKLLYLYKVDFSDILNILNYA